MLKQKTQTGFTFVELMVTLAIAAIVVRIAIPSFSSMISNSRLTVIANQFLGTLSYARSEAVKRGVRVVVLHKDQADGVWETGWDVFADADGDGLFISDVASQCLPNQDCLLRTYDALPDGYTLRTGASDYKVRAVFTPSGMAGSWVGDTFKLCDPSLDIQYSRRIVINSMGRASIKTDPPAADTCDI